jgi:hypothetical protein
MNGSGAHTLLTHILANWATLPHQLKRLHDLALYDSGDALLDSDDKEALHNVRELAERMETLDEKDYRILLTTI